MSEKKIGKQFDALMTEADPERRRALSRRFRAEIWESLDPEDREKIENAGIRVKDLKGPLRGIE